jgi:hypothetical protein
MLRQVPLINCRRQSLAELGLREFDRRDVIRRTLPIVKFGEGVEPACLLWKGPPRPNALRTTLSPDLT